MTANQANDLIYIADYTVARTERTLYLLSQVLEKARRTVNDPFISDLIYLAVAILMVNL